MQSLKEKDKLYIWHPYTAFLPAPEPILIVKGKGSYIENDEGNQYLDAISSWWVTLHGHGHPYIAEKIYRQALELEQVIFAGFTHRPAIELAERLLQVLPGSLSKIFYSDNGSTAVEVAIKMALQDWWNFGETKRTRVLAFRNAYHGDTFGSMSVSDRSVFTRAFEDKLFEVVFIDTPTAENIATLKNLVEQESDTIAAFIYEPLVQGAGGMKMYDAVLLNELLATCKSSEVICIADEVMTGFGRTGRLFASEYAATKPDLICLSKGITGGTMALGATACNQRIADAFMSEDRLKTFFHGHSFTANPIACAAALASLDLLQKTSCLENISAITARNLSFVNQVSACPTAKNARACGTIMAFDYDSGRYDYLSNVSSKITAFMLERGVYLRPLGNTVYIMPPYCMLMEELDRVYAVIVEYLKLDRA